MESLADKIVRPPYTDLPFSSPLFFSDVPLLRDYAFLLLLSYFLFPYRNGRYREITREKVISKMNRKIKLLVIRDVRDGLKFNN